jgi:hypothetical protein
MAAQNSLVSTAWKTVVTLTGEFNCTGISFSSLLTIIFFLILQRVIL